MSSVPHWTAIVNASAVPIIALFASWIAFRQSQIAAKKLKLDLFDKRMAVYNSAREALGAVSRHGKLTQEEENSYLVGTGPAQWLFGPEVVEYLNQTLWRMIVELGMRNSMMEGPPSDERTQNVLARAETMKSLMAQYKELDRLCAKYLTLK